MKKKIFSLLFIIFSLLICSKVSATSYYYYESCSYLGVDPFDYYDKDDQGRRCVPSEYYVVGTYLYSKTSLVTQANLSIAYQSIPSMEYLNVYQKEEYDDVLNWYARFDSNGTKQTPYVTKDSDGQNIICITHVDNKKLDNSYCPSPKSDQKVTFNYPGGTSETVYFVEGTTVVPPKNPVETGSEFVCWHLKTSEEDEGESCYEFTGPTTPNAVFEPVFNQYVYGIFYDLNGGSGVSPQSHSCSYADFGNAACEVTDVIPTRNGYSFLGWSATVAATGSNGEMDDGLLSSGDALEDVLHNANGSVLTLHAVWSANEYNITYNLAGGNFTGNPASKYTYGEGATLVSASRPGYTFNGWFTAATGGTQVESISSTDTGDKALYAHWTAKTFYFQYP